MPQFTRLLFLSILLFAFSSNSYAQREEITLEAFFKRIEESIDTSVYFENLDITGVDDFFSQEENDSFKIIVEKNLVFENVVFDFFLVLSNIHFKGNVEFINSYFWGIKNSIFEKYLVLKVDEKANFNQLSKYSFCSFSNSRFQGSVFINIDNVGLNGFEFKNNEVFLSKSSTKYVDDFFWEGYGQGIDIVFKNVSSVDLSDNKFELTDGFSSLIILEAENLTFTSNSIDSKVNFMRIADVNAISIFDNKIEHPFVLNNFDIKSSDYIKWMDFQNLVINQNGYQQIYPEIEPYSQYRIDSLAEHYAFKDEFVFNNHQLFLGKFLDFYKSQHNRYWGNLVFLEMKNLETKRLQHLYENDKTFGNYFQLKVNQFIKVFSDYGTKPSKAIVISIYVILLFAIFYLFFPNSWDEKNKHRIMNRMLFFAKYFRQKEGMKEVFEDEHRPQIMAYEDFKGFISDSKNEIPPYFITLSKPIYAFSVANFKIRSKILSKADILKGKWSELPRRRKAVTSIIMAFWLLGILLYDLFVKFFNALMLSINTFSTLGFGEIPIKGLPRYLAIMQGFLGWFMLSIFSVSLISQLLN
jgi:hypothetical protein